jgi:hypothetical protein
VSNQFLTRPRFISQILLPATLAALLTSPLGAATIGINSPSNTYYVGVEDATRGDYDYNDLIFSITSNKTLTLDAQYGSGFQQSQQPALYAPLTTASNNGTPFWNNQSSDGAFSNFGECMYDNGVHNTCTGSAFEPTASYLAGRGASQGSVDFYFDPSNNAIITVTLLDSITSNGNDRTDLYYCPESSTSGCTQINLGGSTTFSFLTSGNFDLELRNGGGSFYDSNTTVRGDSDPGVSHFAVAVGTPEPASFALVGGALLGLGFIRRRVQRRS